MQIATIVLALAIGGEDPKQKPKTVTVPATITIPAASVGNGEKTRPEEQSNLEGDGNQVHQLQNVTIEIGGSVLIIRDATTVDAALDALKKIRAIEGAKVQKGAALSLPPKHHRVLTVQPSPRARSITRIHRKLRRLQRYADGMAGRDYYTGVSR